MYIYIVHRRGIIEKDTARRREIVIELPVLYTPEKGAEKDKGDGETGNQQKDYNAHGSCILICKTIGGTPFRK